MLIDATVIARGDEGTTQTYTPCSGVGAAPPSTENRTDVKEDTVFSLLAKEEGNQDQWARQLSQCSGPAVTVAEEFGEPRFQVLQRLVAAGLTHPRWEAAPLDTFLENPDSFIDPVDSPRIHLFIEPESGRAFQRLKFKNITREQALEICEWLKQNCTEREGLVATVLESPKLRYHGNVVVRTRDDCVGEGTRRGSSVLAEFVSGDSPPVSRPGVNPEFRMWQDPFLETFRYNVESPGVRQTLFDTLKLIPRVLGDPEYDGIRPTLAPGYYEVGITETELGGVGRAYLYDMKPRAVK